MKKQATFNEYTITIAESGCVEVFKQFANTLGVIGEIVSFEIDAVKQ